MPPASSSLRSHRRCPEWLTKRIAPVRSAATQTPAASLTIARLVHGNGMRKARRQPKGCPVRTQRSRYRPGGGDEYGSCTIPGDPRRRTQAPGRPRAQRVASMHAATTSSPKGSTSCPTHQDLGAPSEAPPPVLRGPGAQGRRSTTMASSSSPITRPAARSTTVTVAREDSRSLGPRETGRHMNASNAPKAAPLPPPIPAPLRRRACRPRSTISSSIPWGRPI